MTCDDYLAMLETLPLEELSYGAAREHATHCHDCNRVTRVVVERERSMILAFGDVRPSMTAADVALGAVAAARRRRLAAYSRVGLAVAAVAALVIAAVSRLVPRSAAAVRVHETFLLQCLSPDQAAVLLRTHLQQPERVSIRARPPVGAIDVDAPPPLMAQVRGLIDRYDDPSRTKCAVQVVVPK